MKRHLPPVLVGAAIGNTGQENGAQDMPGLLPDILGETHRGAVVKRTGTSTGLQALEDVVDFSERLAREVKDILLAGENMPWVIGGDHTCAIGTWSGVSARYGHVGLIWIDAHMDAHMPSSSPSGNLHGMPLAALLGHGPTSLTDVLAPGPKLNACAVAVMGARAWEPAEHALLTDLGVKIYETRDILDQGFEATFGQARRHIRAPVYGVSVDMDVFDPADVPSVGTPVPGGIDIETCCRFFQEFEDPNLVAVELVELNPRLAGRDRSLRAFSRLCKAMLG